MTDLDHKINQRFEETCSGHTDYINGIATEEKDNCAIYITMK